MEDEIKILLEMGDKNGKVFTRIVKTFELTPLIMAGLTYSTYEALLNTVSDNQQIKFQEEFFKFFNILLKNGHHYLNIEP